jgi:hypothetical protein
MILVWLLVWLLESTPHIQILPLDHMNAWGLTLILALILA